MALFLSVQTQWRVSGMGQRIGLDYAGVEAFCRINGLDITQDIFGKMQVLERTMLVVDREHASKN